MKKLLFPILLICFYSVVSQTPCVGGFAGPYPCEGYILQSELNLASLGAGGGNDSWGWTDPTNGDEYAIVGLNNGTAFINITDPINPVYLGKLPTQTSNSSWRDVKTYNNYAFIVSEAGGHGMQVFDLTRLRSVTAPPMTFTTDAHFNGFGSAHNIVINEASGYAYPVGASQYNGGPIFINIQDPLNPVAEGGYSMGSYSHDAQVVTYCGPDADYAGREILIGSNANEVVIVDITNKSNPIGISTISYSNVGYTHQGWFTEDQQYFLLGDETDEQGIGFDTRTIVFDFEDLDSPQLHMEYYGPTPAIDHNGYVNGTKFYLANYRAGLRVLDISDIANSNITEEGFFDTYPNNNNANFSGAWNVYPFFESGNIVISDINRGFLLVKPETFDNVDPIAVCDNITVDLDSNGNAVISSADIDNGSSDDSGTVYMILCETNFDCSDLGANQVTLEVYDDFGNRDFCTSTVTVEDNIAPIMTCPGNMTETYTTGQGSYTLPDYVANAQVTATDNCTTGLTVTQTPAAGTELMEGSYTIEFATTDSEGNPTNCSFELTVAEILSTEENNFELGLRLYPNPSNEVLNVSSTNQILESIKIMDVSGKILLAEQNINSLNKTIELSAFANGILFVEVNNRVVKRIVKF